MAKILDLGDAELLKAFHAWLLVNPKQHIQEPTRLKVIEWVIANQLNKGKAFFGASIGKSNPYTNSMLMNASEEFACNYERWRGQEKAKELAGLKQNPEYHEGFKSGYYSPWTLLLTTPKDNTPFARGYADGRNNRCFERR